MDGDFIEVKQPFNNTPTQEEIEDYAEWLGADLQNDRDLFWIAKEALQAPIPPGWKLYQRKDGTGEPFYFNLKTGESLWDHPLDAHYKELFKEEKAKKMRGGSFPTAKPLLSSNTNTRQSSNLNPNRQKFENERNEYQQNFDEEMRILKQRNENEKKELVMRMEQEIEDLRASHRRKMESIRTANQTEQDAQNNLSIQLKQKRLNLDQELRLFEQKLEQQKSELELNFKKEIQNLKASHQEEIDNENKLLKNKLDSMKRVNQEEMENEKSRHEREMEILKKSNETARTEEERILKEKEIQNDQINSMRTEFEKKKKTLTNKYNDEIEQLNLEHENNIAALRKKQKEEISKQELKQNQQNELKEMIADFEDEKAELKRKQENEIQKIVAQHNKEIDLLRQKGQEEQNELRNQIQAQQNRIKPTTNDSLQPVDLERIKKQIERKCRSEVEQEYQNEIEEMRLNYENTIAALKQRPKDLNLPLEKQIRKHQLELEQEAENHKQEMRLLKANFEIEKKKLEASINNELENIELSHRTKTKKRVRSRSSNMSFASFIPISMSPMERLSKNALHLTNTSEYEQYTKPPPLQIRKYSIFETNNFLQFSSPFPMYSQMDNMYGQSMIQQPQMNNSYGKSMVQQSQVSQQQQMIISSNEQVHKIKKIHNNVDQSCILLTDSMKLTSNEVEKSAQNFDKFFGDQNKVMTQMKHEFQTLTTKLATSLNSIFEDIDNSYREAVTNFSFKNQTAQPQIQMAPMQIPYQMQMQQSPPPPEKSNRAPQSQPTKKHRSRSHRDRDPIKSINDSEIARIEANFKPLKKKLDERRKESETRIDSEVSKKLKRHAKISKQSSQGIRELQYKLKAMRDFVDNSD